MADSTYQCKNTIKFKILWILKSLWATAQFFPDTFVLILPFSEGPRGASGVGGVICNYWQKGTFRSAITRRKFSGVDVWPGFQYFQTIKCKLGWYHWEPKLESWSNISRTIGFPLTGISLIWVQACEPHCWTIPLGWGGWVGSGGRGGDRDASIYWFLLPHCFTFHLPTKSKSQKQGK